ncbi:hypothetical protein [Hafnia alvei]|uniref:hypothetical protein n=1 Tax=Hafnia alvei TaxID=569 RepID=UPI00187D6B0E|nr:hypothetical protein [Hafnia alvei]
MNETIDPLEQQLLQWMRSPEMIPVMNDQIAQLEAVADHRTGQQEKRMMETDHV